MLYSHFKKCILFTQFLPVYCLFMSFVSLTFLSYFSYWLIKRVYFECRDVK